MLNGKVGAEQNIDYKTNLKHWKAAPENVEFNSKKTHTLQYHIFSLGSTAHLADSLSAKKQVL